MHYCVIFNFNLYKMKKQIFSNSVASEPFVSYNSSKPLEEFDLIQKFAEINKGIVMPYLNESYVDIVEVEPHDFTSENPLEEARIWAEKNLIGSYIVNRNKLSQFKYEISKKAIKKYVHHSSTNKSENLFVHLSVLKVLPKVINASIEVEIHADYKKVHEIRSAENPINEKVLIHRFYGAILLLHKFYRIKITIYEYRNMEFPNKPHSFEVIKIELLDESNSSILTANHPNSQGGLITSTANILQNVEKSYDKGKFLLEESKKDEEYYNGVIFRH